MRERLTKQVFSMVSLHFWTWDLSLGKNCGRDWDCICMISMFVMVVKQKYHSLFSDNFYQLTMTFSIFLSFLNSLSALTINFTGPQLLSIIFCVHYCLFIGLPLWYLHLLLPEFCSFLKLHSLQNMEATELKKLQECVSFCIFKRTVTTSDN